jgi:Cu-Zn family superoxide dismutase
VVTFKPVEKGKVQVLAKITGLAPNSKHAIHIHQYGDLTSKDGKSAGEHYNPMGHQHALPDQEMRHAGDFGNLEADASGNATLELTVDNLSLAGRMSPIIGRAVVVHAKPDDGSQPSGNAGDRLAVGVIGVKNPKS